MFYVEFLVDDEPYELELRPGMFFTKCAKCGKKIYGYWHIGVENEMLCETCTPPHDPKKKLIEYLKKHMRVTFTEKEIDASFEKGDSELFLEEIYRRQKGSRHGKSSRSSVMTGEKHPSVKIIPATK